MKRKVISILFFLFVICITGIGNAGTIVYDNLNIGGSYWTGFGLLETADLINLDGSNRNLTEIKIQTYYEGSVRGNADTQVRIYNDQHPSLIQPYTLLWDSGINDLLYSPGLNTLAFLIPGILVPDSIWWSIQISNPDAGIGLLLNDPPTVGSSPNNFAMKDSTWALYGFTGGDPVANLGAQVSAVPEPATMLLLGTGLVGLAGAARRRKKNQV